VRRRARRVVASRLFCASRRDARLTGLTRARSARGLSRHRLDAAVGAVLRAVDLGPFVRFLKGPLADGGLEMGRLEADHACRELLRFLALKVRAIAPARGPERRACAAVQLCTQLGPYRARGAAAGGAQGLRRLAPVVRRAPG
jgi:hypothetical protein